MLVGIPSRAHQQKRTCKWSRQLTIFLEHVCNMFNLDLVSIRNFPKLNTSFVTEWKNGIVCPIHTPNCAKTSQNTTQWICIGSLYKATQPFKCKNVCQNENHPYLIVLFFYHKSAQIHNKHQKWIKKIMPKSKKTMIWNKLFTNGKGFERCKNINKQYTWKNPAGLKTDPHFAHLGSQITHENTIICNVLRVFFNVECVKKWHSKQNHSGCGFPPHNHDIHTSDIVHTLCPMVCQKHLYAFRPLCCLCHRHAKGKHMLAEWDWSQFFLLCVVTNWSKIAWFNEGVNNHQHRPSFKDRIVSFTLHHHHPPNIKTQQPTTNPQPSQ